MVLAVIKGGHGGLMLEELTLLKRQEKSSLGREPHTESINQTLEKKELGMF